MIGLQEMQRRLEKPDNEHAQKQVMEMLDHGYYDYDEVNIFGTGIGFGGTRNSTSCLLYTSPSPRDQRGSRMPSSA